MSTPCVGALWRKSIIEHGNNSTDTKHHIFLIEGNSFYYSCSNRRSTAGATERAKTIILKIHKSRIL